MSTIQNLIDAFQFNRGRTLATLDEIEKLPDPQAALAYRLAPGRAHIAWQFMHIGVTEDIFANERLVAERPGRFSELWPRFRGGSTADDNIPDLATIRQVLAGGREALLETLAGFSDSQLGEIPPQLAEKKWNLLTVLHIVAWHEGHHQGQAHAMLNSFRAHNL
jgi:uncharacterized damage-inducible protein DinB